MILDSLIHASVYKSLHHGFAQAFDFLQRTDWDSVSDGKIELQSDALFVIVASDIGRGRQASPLEVHQRYIDIQYVISGHENCGWSPLMDCRHLSHAYDPARDIAFFSDSPQSWLDLASGQFAIFFPHDAHAPLAGSGALRKAVVKVQVS